MSEENFSKTGLSGQEPTRTNTTSNGGETYTGLTGHSSGDSRRLRGSDQLRAIDQILRQANEDDPADIQADGEPGDQAGAESGDADTGTGDGGGPSEEASLGRGADREKQAEPEAQQEQKGPPETFSVKELAERLEIDPGALYNALQVTTGDGETATLAELKDVFAGKAQSERESAEQAAELTRREARIATDIQALAVLDAMQAVPQQMREQAASHLQQMAEREYQKFLALVPEMQDDGARIQMDKDVAELLGDYGLTMDHFAVKPVGLWRLARDIVRDRKQLRKLTAPKAKKAPLPTKPARAGQKPKPPPLTGARGRQAELDQISALLATERKG